MTQAAELRNDWIAWAGSTGMGLWACLWGDGRVLRPAAPWDEARDSVLELLTDLVLTEVVLTIDLVGDGEIERWEGPPSSHLLRIRDQWTRLSRRPHSGEIAHFVTQDRLGIRCEPTQATVLTAIDAAWLREEFLAEDDATSIVTFSDPVRFALGGPSASNELVRTETLAVLGPLVLSGAIVLGEYGKNGFRRWDGDAVSHLARLGADWSALRRDVLPGDLGFWALAGRTWVRINPAGPPR